MKRFFRRRKNDLKKWWRHYKINNLQGKEYYIVVMNRKVTHRVLWLKDAGINRNARFGGGWDTECGFQKGGNTIIVNLCWSSTRIDIDKICNSKYILFKIFEVNRYDVRGRIKMS